MDPNLFHIDWERTIEALVGIIIIAFIVERACALIFESRWWIAKFEDPRVGNGSVQSKTDANVKLVPINQYPIKEVIAFIVALIVCIIWDFDAISIILLSTKTSFFGKFLTALVIAGGSKASIKLFHDILKIKSNAETERRLLKIQDKKLEGLK